MTVVGSGRRERTKRVVFTIAMASIAAACTTQESSQPGPTLTSVATTTSTTVSATTTIATTSTTSIPETATTESTTTIVAPSGPVDASVPLLIGGGSDNWLLLGTWQVDHWASALGDNGEPITPSIQGDPTFAISGLGFAQKRGVVGPNGEACVDGRVGPSIDVTVPQPEPPGFGYSAIALPSSWSLRPRQVALIAGGVPAYQTLGIDAFADESVDAALGTVAQIVVVDLDGNGTDEAIVAFEHVQNPSIPGTVGDLAAMLLIDTESRSSQTIISNVVAEDDSAEESSRITERYRVLDVADLNGDGRMEVIVHASFFEGASVIVYEYNGTDLNEVLSTGCGI